MWLLAVVVVDVVAVVVEDVVVVVVECYCFFIIIIDGSPRPPNFFLCSPNTVKTDAFELHFS